MSQVDIECQGVVMDNDPGDGSEQSELGSDDIDPGIKEKEDQE